VALGALLAPAFGACVLGYLVLSAAYTRWLRDVAIVEAVAIAGGFGIRAGAGAAAIGVPASGWLIALAVLGALFVLWLKREQELATLGPAAAEHRAVLARYSPRFLAVAVGVTGWWIGGVFAAYAVRRGAPGGGALLLVLVPIALGLWRFAVLARGAEARPVDQLVARDLPLLGSVVLFIGLSFAVLALGR
jgi:decaprenyl-phosphate phosphoribosyltransferase